MQLSLGARSLIFRVARKEVTLFFASPIAYLFLAAFAAITLFAFFWGEAFFSRNIADVRPLFEWMPLLLIFLASTLTMRLWSEERRTGTLEYVLTQPAPLWLFVVGKFLGCLVLLSIALLVTLPLPVTVSILGDLDWGPVIAGYIATFFLGAAYLSIGLFVSARSQNQIVSLIWAVALCGFFYMLGSAALTKFVGYETGEWLRLFGTGSRFESITRGVIDLRDIYFYLSIIIAFLALNTYSLEKERWASHARKPNHAAWHIITLLLVLNAVGGNLWLGQINSLRVDTTEGNQYSISPATHSYLQRLQEPLLLRGYFSEKTHHLLAPLVPQLRDLIREYEIAGKGKVRVEFVDPAQNPELEQEANQKYGIQPVPFQVADRHQAAIVSSYFNVLIRYGDQHETLSFGDLIEVKASSGSDIDVQLRNPEHDLTRAIKKVLKSYQAGGNLFDTVEGELEFNAYISPDGVLPEQLVAFRKEVESVLAEAKEKAGERLTVNYYVPEANNGKIAQQIMQDFGFQPMATSIFSQESFYFYLTLAKGDQIVQIPMDDMTQEGFERNFDAAVKRFASGFTKTLALVTPPAADPQMAMYGMGGDNAPQFNRLEQFLGAEFNIEREDLSDGQVSGQADILLLLAPSELDDKQVFAVDQFLMQGGTVVAASSPYSAQLSNKSMQLQEHNSGLQAWLSHHGITIDKTLVLDTQNASFPVPVTRKVGGFSLQDIRMLDYPYFVDVREDGLNQANLITSELPQLTFTWASPIQVDAEKNAERKVTTLVQSSETSWLSSSTDIMPRLEAGTMTRYVPEGEQKPHTLAMISAGRFESYYAGKSSPLIEEATPADENSQEKTAAEPASTDDFAVTSVIERSTDASRIILFSSNDFLRDEIVGMLGSAVGSQYLNTLQLAANTLDWSLEDASLLSIRSRGHFNRTLPPMERDRQVFWEYLNYALAAAALFLIAAVHRIRRNTRRRQFQQLLAA